jgi:hypothetical protein
MLNNLILVDDFLDSVDQLREAALRLQYPRIQGQFPGRNSQQRINLEGLSEQVSHLVGEPVIPIDPPESHGKCRLTLANDKGRGKVHIDHCYWSGILYLSRPEDCHGGTDFFRHIRTQSDRAPLTRKDLAKMGYDDFDKVHRDLVELEGTQEDKWELTMTVPMRYNRLVLLRPWMWHTAGPGFGDRTENGRLVFLMFFRKAPGQHHG